eukprot:6484128-Amphidinium_carterae.1
MMPIRAYTRPSLTIRPKRVKLWKASRVEGGGDDAGAAADDVAGVKKAGAAARRERREDAAGGGDAVEAGKRRGLRPRRAPH